MAFIDDEPCEPLKLILLGNGSVGKKSIIMRFVYDGFTDDNTMPLNGGFSTGSRTEFSSLIWLYIPT